MLHHKRSKLDWYKSEWANIGKLSWPLYKAKKLALRFSGHGDSVLFKAKRASFPVRLRAGSSDMQVFNQVMIEREYGCLDGIHDPKLIIDCGANIGLASAYLLSSYPNAKLIAIEPDDDNFKLLQLNLAPYGDRCLLIKSGVWSTAGGLIVERAKQGNEWGVTVREAKQGEQSDLFAVDLESLLKQSGFDRIDILKIDIEGSERDVFSRNTSGWIDKFDNLAIELHGAECSAVVKKALAHRNLVISTSGELTVFKPGT